MSLLCKKSRSNFAHFYKFSIFLIEFSDKFRCRNSTISRRKGSIEVSLPEEFSEFPDITVKDIKLCPTFSTPFRDLREV